MKTPFIFLTVFDYPTRFAHAVHGLHMARAFSAREDLDFHFVVNMAKSGTLTGIPYMQLFGSIGRWVKRARLRRLLLMPAFFKVLLQCRTNKDSVVFINDPALLWVVLIGKFFFRYHIVLESHSLLPEKKRRQLQKYATAVFGVSAGICEDFERTIEKSKVHLLPNAVDVAAYAHLETSARDEVRNLLHVGKDTVLMGYVGRLAPLGEDKGIALMLEGLAQLPARVSLLLVGGVPQEEATFREVAKKHGVEKRVHFIAHVAPDSVPRYVVACDVLVFVPPGGTVFFEKETSPMKLYEYMASKRPIIVSDVPTNRGVLSDTEARFVRAGSMPDFVAAVAEVTSPMNAPVVFGRVEAAYSRVRGNSWEHRVEEIVKRART